MPDCIVRYDGKDEVLFWYQDIVVLVRRSDLSLRKLDPEDGKRWLRENGWWSYGLQLHCAHGC